MRQGTIRKALTEAALHTLTGVDACEVRDVEVRKGTKANGGAVKLVDATLVVRYAAQPGLQSRVRLTGIATEALRDTPAARKALRKFVGRVALGPGWVAEETTPKADGIRDIAADHAQGPVCGAHTATGDPCQRPSADGSACWQHGGDAARKGLVAKADGNVRTHKATARQPKASDTVDWEAIARVAAEAAARAAVEAIAAHATA